MSDRNTKIAELRQAVRKFNDDRDWNKWHDPKSVSLSIMLEAAELAEHFQWLQEKDDLKKFDRKKWQEIKDELADIIIYCLLFANTTGIDITDSVNRKLNRNKRKYPVRLFNKNRSDDTAIIKRTYRNKRKEE